MAFRPVWMPSSLADLKHSVQSIGRIFTPLQAWGASYLIFFPRNDLAPCQIICIFARRLKDLGADGNGITHLM
ncbi:Hypothetical predicted protein [Olea europaea subsp. europaea]|uniref:Uncharacterized protein n=1 Tax=Olea europaea subsp. europaea TaxID=158383 RepID=A0A8S0V2U5_OLEEU|nr:Hypothetical predicted protein [Olea europaea subsp. europaea]